MQIIIDIIPLKYVFLYIDINKNEKRAIYTCVRIRCDRVYVR